MLFRNCNHQFCTLHQQLVVIVDAGEHAAEMPANMPRHLRTANSSTPQNQGAPFAVLRTKASPPPHRTAGQSPTARTPAGTSSSSPKNSYHWAGVSSTGGGTTLSCYSKCTKTD